MCYVSVGKVPSFHAVGSPLATLGTYVLLTWRGYIRESEVASNDRQCQLQSNSAQANLSSKQASTYDATTKGSQVDGFVGVVVEVAQSGVVSKNGEGSELTMERTLNSNDALASSV